MHDLFYMWKLRKERKPKYIETDRRIVVNQGGGGRRDSEEDLIQVKGYEVLVMYDE